MSGLYNDQHEKDSDRRTAAGIKEEAAQFEMELTDYLLFQILNEIREQRASVRALYNLIDERTQ